MANLHGISMITKMNYFLLLKKLLIKLRDQGVYFDNITVDFKIILSAENNHVAVNFHLSYRML